MYCSCIMDDMNGIRIRGAALRELRHQKRLSGAKLGQQVGRTNMQVYRVEKEESKTSFEFLDRLVPLFGADKVADLIVDEDQRRTFLAAHLTTTGSRP